ncbi:MAG: hypothetical protein JWO03_987 [Bacteroidetes bacterium]|nr:hypothetical protein [Bacteroidota bacterium]
MNTPKRSSPYLLLLLPLIYFAIFLHLDSLPFRLWDESYLAMHTYEMMQTGDPIVVRDFTAPEMSNTKPPLVIWCMAGMSKLIGFNELSIRLPNAIAGALLCIGIFLFISYRYRTPVAAFASVLIMISSTGLIRQHVFRTGEYDAFLVTFVFIFSIAYFLLLQPDRADKRNGRLWTIFTIAMIGAIWTKGIAAMMIMPALLVYTLIQKKLVTLLRSKEFYISALTVVVFGMGYYVLREHYNPGYMQAVYDNELGGRFIKTNDGHEGPFWYYIQHISEAEKIWISFFVIGILSLFSKRENPLRPLLVFCVVVVFLFVTVISVSATKLDWYDAPMIPFFAIISGIGAYVIIDSLFNIGGDKVFLWRKIAAVMALLVIAAPGYIDIIYNDQSIAESSWDGDAFNMSHYLRQRDRSPVNMDGYKIVYNQSHLVRIIKCETKVLEYKGQKVELVRINKLREGDIVLTGQANVRDSINALFTHQTLETYYNVEKWKLLERKPETPEPRSLMNKNNG